MDKWLFKSDRLGFRGWNTKDDLEHLLKINQDPKAMEFFPAVQKRKTTEAFIEKQNISLGDKGFCFFCVDLIETSDPIGFIGLSEVSFEEFFTPAIEIGWRLSPNHWNQGYATEGAKRCLHWAFEEKLAERIVSFTAVPNKRSENVMLKCGMTYLGNFKHPKLQQDHWLQEHLLYEIRK